MIRKDLFAIVFVIAGLATTNVQAQQPIEGSSKTLPTNEPTFMQGGYIIEKIFSENIFDIGVRVNKEKVSQTTVGINFDGGWNFEYYLSTPLKLHHFNKTYTEEDYTLTKRFKAGDFDLSAAVSIYDLASVGTVEKGDFIALIGEADYRKLMITDDFSLTPYLLAKMNFSRGYKSYGDTVWYLGTKFDYQVTPGLHIGGRTALVYNPGIAGSDRGVLLNADIAPQITLYDGHVTIEGPGLHAIVPIWGSQDVEDHYPYSLFSITAKW